MHGNSLAPSATSADLDITRYGYVDALQYSNWDRELLLQWRTGNIACVHVTVAIWEGTRDTMRTIGRWNRRFREHSDLIAPARTAEEIMQVAASGRTAVVLGFQNGSPFEDDLSTVELFHDMGVRIGQLTYNIANHIGSSCYEPIDAGLTRFGKHVVKEMNRVGMIVDLSHVGKLTTLDAIQHSERPVMVSHGNPDAVWPHARNLSDDLLRELSAHGGLLGCAPYPHLTGGDEVSGRQWAEGVAHAVTVMGIDHVGIGTDSSHKWTDEDLHHIRMGHWTHEMNYGAGSPDKPGWLPWPQFFRTPEDFPGLADSLAAVGFDEAERNKLMGGNLIRLYAAGFSPRPV
ncbi:MAG: membrane dipeptidase [Candidatus Nanopelagicales bacterium]